MYTRVPTEGTEVEQGSFRKHIFPKEVTLGSARGSLKEIGGGMDRVSILVGQTVERQIHIHFETREDSVVPKIEGKVVAFW